MVRRNLRTGLAPWCHCAAGLGNPELLNQAAAGIARSNSSRPSRSKAQSSGPMGRRL